MSEKAYKTCILITYISVMAIICSENVTWLVNDLITAISSSCLLCFFPGIFYLLSLKYTKMEDIQQAQRRETIKNTRLAKLYIFFGIIIFVGQLTNVGLKTSAILDKLGGDANFRNVMQYYNGNRTTTGRDHATAIKPSEKDHNAEDPCAPLFGSGSDD